MDKEDSLNYNVLILSIATFNTPQRLDIPQFAFLTTKRVFNLSICERFLKFELTFRWGMDVLFTSWINVEFKTECVTKNGTDGKLVEHGLNTSSWLSISFDNLLTWVKVFHYNIIYVNIYIIFGCYICIIEHICCKNVSLDTTTP